MKGILEMQNTFLLCLLLERYVYVLKVLCYQINSEICRTVDKCVIFNFFFFLFSFFMGFYDSGSYCGGGLEAKVVVVMYLKCM